MSKQLSLLFATLGILCLSALSISIAYSYKWVIFWGVMTLLIIGLGFMVKKKARLKESKADENRSN